MVIHFHKISVSILILTLFVFLSGCRYRIVDVQEQQELKLRIDNIRKDISRLEKTMEKENGDQQENMSKLRAEFNQMTLKLDRNFEMMSGKLDDNRNRLAKFGRSGARINKSKDSTIRQGSDNKASSEDIKKLFNIGRDDFNGRSYDRAIKCFREILKDYSRANLSDNAQFWIGECYFATKKYNEAIVEYRKVVDEYPESDVLAKAFYKIGLAYQYVKNDRMKTKAWKILLKKFPTSDESLIVKEREKETSE